jgi:hypothetical protein
LSAAPVVATLRPGEALANSSAFQCAAKIRDDLTLIPVVDDPSTDGFVRRELFSWVLVANSQRQDDDGNLVPLLGTGITEQDLNARLSLVSMNPTAPDPNGSDIYIRPPNNESGTFTPERLVSGFSDGARAEVVATGASNEYLLRIFNSSQQLCLAGQSEKRFWAVSYTATNGDTHILENGTFPETQVFLRNVPAGEPQGMTHSCLCSFHPNSIYCQG